MADTVKTTKNLLIDTLYTDGDTRRITLKNAKNTITTEEITALNTLILNGDDETLLVGDKNGAQFKQISLVTKRNETVLTLDLSAAE